MFNLRGMHAVLNLNGKQIISIIGAVLSVLMISTAQLTDLFGPGVAKSIVSIAGLGNLVLQSIMTAITSQGSTVQSVLDMPGVEKLDINRQANSTLAAMAVDPHVDKISPIPGDVAKVTQTAHAA